MAAALALAFGLPTSLRAQESPQEVRTISMWVDPKFGNDSFAAQLNVTVTNPLRCLGTEIAPVDVLDTAGRPLLHQPYPFKTITAAVNYINSLPPTVSATDPLPYLSPITGYRWDFAVIHLLPGRYASVAAPEASPSLHNELVANGETFPIQLPNRVSIQGTSALDTVIELSQKEGPAFLFGETSTTCGVESFISSISVMGGTGDLNRHAPTNPPFPTQYASAAIALSRNHACKLRLDNCFFFANGVGVMTDRDPLAQIIHEVAILNCNFVWNAIGIWSGDVLSQTPTFGVSKFLLANNIFDTSAPPLGILVGGPCSPDRAFPARWRQAANDMFIGGVYGVPVMSAFEGLNAGDLDLVTSTGLQNFNAYEIGAVARFDKRVPYPSMFLPATGPTPTLPGPPLPTIDLAPFTGAAPPGFARGVLFVADLFRNGIPLPPGNPAQRFATTTSCGFDLSPMDFRLAPAVAPANNPSLPRNTPGDPSTGGMLNPLVDRGYGVFPMSSSSGVTLAAHPRALPVGNGTWPFASWSDFDDCEGMGNRRVFDHPAYANHALATVPIDIGADEADLLIIAGFRYGTRTFTRHDSASPLIRADNRFVWVLGPPTTLAAQPPGQGTQALQYSANWWASPGPAAYNNLGWIGWDPTASTGYYNPLVAHITPHLLPDVHPYHAVTLNGQWPTNPVWQDCGPLQPLHNVFLYIDPTEPLPNPAGVYPAVPVPGFSLLDGITSPWSGHVAAIAGIGGSPVAPFGLAPGGGRFDFGGANSLGTFGGWCQCFEIPSSPGQWPGTAFREAHILGDMVGTPAFNTWNNVYPHIDPKDTIPPNQTGFEFPDRGVQRITVELMQQPGGTWFGYSGPSNVQTFMLWRHAGGN